MTRDFITAMAPLHVCDVTMLYAAQSGGVRRYIEAKHDWLSGRAGIRHSLVAPGGRDAAPVPYLHAPAAWAPPCFGGFRFPLRMAPWRAAVERLAPDLIEAGDPYLPGWAALDAGQRLGVPTVAFHHSDLPSLARARFGAHAGRVAQRYVVRVYAQFDCVLVPSGAMQRELQRLGLSRTRVLRLGVDPRRFHPSKRSRQVRRELGLASATRLLVFAGRNAREKRLDSLVRAVELLGPAYHLLLIGPGMAALASRNVTAISRYVDVRELASLLAGCDALVHAGDAETFGLIVLEAMASGLPVVGVNAGAVPELVTPQTGTLARSSAPAHLAEAVTALFDHDVRAMGAAARHAVEACWTWERSFCGLLDVYQRLLGASHANDREDLARAAG